MKKQIIFFILVFCTIFFSGCKKNEEIPLYQDKIYLDTVAFGIPVYYGEFNITTNIGINYQNGLGGALRAGYFVNHSTMCDSNTFLFTLPIVTEPNKIYNVYPQITRNLQISDVPFKVGKFKIIDIAYGDKKNCSVDTFPRAGFDIVQLSD